MLQFRQEGRRRTVRLTENATHAEAARELIQIWRGEFSKLRAQEKVKTVMLREMVKLGCCDGTDKALIGSAIAELLQNPGPRPLNADEKLQLTTLRNALAAP